MNCIFITVDSLNRHFLSAYGCKVEFDVRTPNIDRLARRAAVFECHFAGSLPCMPARREFFAGVQEFLWRPWGPMEPFDAPLARVARRGGVVPQLVTDHYHYFQHGSHGYYEDYMGYELIRGHEYDAWRTAPRRPDPNFLRQILADQPEDTGFLNRAAYARNVADFKTEEDFFPAKVFSTAAEWLRLNGQQRPWLLVIDSFDVHEPFHCPEPYASMYTDEDPTNPELILWPRYGRINEGDSQLTDRQLAFVRAQYAGKLTMVDKWLGLLLDEIDRQELWQDTLLILTTDHGHFLGEHGWIGKPNAPMYDVLAHTPLIVWHPESPLMGSRVRALTSAVDLYATMLEALGLEIPGSTHSRSLLPLLLGSTQQHREWAIYGYWGSTVNVTDGHYTYLHPCREDLEATCYSTMMIEPINWFDPPRPKLSATAGRFLPYTDSPVWRYTARSTSRHSIPLLFDIESDPAQQENLAGQGASEEVTMRALLTHALQEISAPPEQYERLALNSP